MYTTFAQPIYDDAMELKASHIRILDDYSYGASILPEEDDKRQFPSRYTLLHDPARLTLKITEDKDLKSSKCHLLLYVINLDSSIVFYHEVLGFQLFRKRSNVNNRPREASFMALVGGQGEHDGVVLELIYKYATETIDTGNVFQELQLTSSALEETIQQLDEHHVVRKA
jgi:hypothetical protein